MNMDSCKSNLSTKKSYALTLAQPTEHSEEIKKSRFIARASPVNSSEEAMEFLQKVREPSATHNCWAYKIGQEYRFNDDGEPGGTAGRPILGAIEQQAMDRVMVVVTRYFGGIKLGAGGLARAYGGVASSCLRLADKGQLIPMTTIRLTLGFKHSSKLHRLTEKFDATQTQEQYTDTGVVAEIKVCSHLVSDFGKAVMNATRGEATFEILEEN